MPELPEVETVRRGLARALVGKRIVRVDVGKTKVIAFGPKTLPPVRTTAASTVRRFRRHLVGRRVRSIGRRAKVLILTLDAGWSLVVHLKLSGQLIVRRARERHKAVPMFNGPGFSAQALPHAHTHVTLAFGDGARLFYNDLRQFGYLRLVRTDELGLVAAVAHAGVEPLSKAFTVRELSSVVSSLPNRSIKGVLLEQTRVAGIGNIYADEALFAARIRPARSAGTLTPAELRALHRAIQRVLNAAIRARGSSVGDYFDPFGKPGVFGLQHKVYGRGGKPCKRCGTTLIRTVVAGRGTVYCPHCQR